MLTLDYRDARPIYGQIKDSLRRLIVAGALGPDEKLPSIRALALDLSINPNTIRRAYTALEQEGFIYLDPGKGRFAPRPGGGAPQPPGGRTAGRPHPAGAQGGANACGRDKSRPYE